MKNHATPIRRTDDIDASSETTPAQPVGSQQLTLLAMPGAATLEPSPVHARFRLSKTTRERGLRHVAEIRRQLAASEATRESGQGRRLPSRRADAA